MFPSSSRSLSASLGELSRERGGSTLPDAGHRRGPQGPGALPLSGRRHLSTCSLVTSLREAQELVLEGGPSIQGTGAEAADQGYGCRESRDLGSGPRLPHTLSVLLAKSLPLPGSSSLT